MHEPAETLDCLIVGAGPAGLTAAVYLARYRRSVLVLHDGRSRALRIPRTYNVPGFPDGVVGEELVGRMTAQAIRYGASIVHGRVDRIERDGELFRVRGEGFEHRARTILIATGVCVAEVDLPRDVHEGAIATGRLRYCPICDGFEATGRRVAVLGADDHGAREALFLRQYTEDVTLLTRVRSELRGDDLRALEAAGVTVVEDPVEALEPGPHSMTVRVAGRPALEFDVLYPALGCDPRTELCAALAVELTDGGCIPTDARQGTSVAGVFAAGDVVEALDQISVAIGHGAIAATNAHNYLRATQPDFEGRVATGRDLPSR